MPTAHVVVANLFLFKMANYTEDDLAKDLENQEYKFGFVTDIETETVPVGLNEDIIRLISSKKNEPQWLLDYRLQAFEIWKGMQEPEWAHVQYLSLIHI